MDKITWQDLPSTSTPLNASNLNTMQSNIEKSVVAVGSTEPSTEENVWLKKGKNLIDASKIMFGTVVHGNGNYSYLTYAAVTDFIPVQPGDYHLKLFNPGTGNNRILVFRIAGYDANKNYLWDDSDLDTTDRTISGSSTRYLRICFAIYGYQTISSLDTIKNSQPQLEVGTSATTFEAYADKQIFTKNANGEFDVFYSEKVLDNYSTNEQQIGTWINGKPLYRIVMTSTSYNSSSYSIPISNVKDIINITGVVRRSDYSNLIEVIPSRLDNAGMSVQFGNITIASATTVTVGMTWGTNWSSAFGSIILILEYTKTTD